MSLYQLIVPIYRPSRNELISRLVVEVDALITMVDQKNYLKTCLSCILHANFDVTEYMFPIQFFCPHKKRHFALKPSCKISVRNSLFIVFFAVIVSAGAISYLLHIPSVCQTVNSSCIMFISDVLFIAGNIALGFMVVSRPSYNILELKALLFFFEHFKEYNLDVVVDDEAALKFKTFRLVAPLVAITTCFFTITWIAFDDYQLSTILRKVAICICYLYQILGCILLLQRITFVGAVLREIERTFGVLLLKFDDDWVKHLGKYEHLVLVLHTMIVLLNVILTPILLVWGFVASTSLIFNIFILLKYEDYDGQNMIMLQVRNLVTIVVILLILAMTVVDIIH